MRAWLLPLPFVAATVLLSLPAAARRKIRKAKFRWLLDGRVEP